MAKKVKILTEGELIDIVAKSVLQVMNEADAKAYAKVHNAAKRIKESRTVKNNEFESRTSYTIIASYKDIRFMFYFKNLRQNVGIVLFKLVQIVELTNEKAVLKGDIVFNNQQMEGAIKINMQNGSAVYHHSSSRKKYPLEIDNRFAQQWDELVNTLQEASQLV